MTEVAETPMKALVKLVHQGRIVEAGEEFHALDTHVEAMVEHELAEHVGRKTAAKK